MKCSWIVQMDLKKIQEEENTIGQEKDSRGRKHKNTRRRLLITNIEVPTSHSSFPWVGGRMSRHWSLIGTTQVNVLFRFDYILPFQTHRDTGQWHTGYRFAMKWEKKSSQVNSAAGLEVAAVGTTVFREGAMLHRHDVDTSTEDAPSKIDVLLGRCNARPISQ